ncbi:MAG: DUF4286 family protein [bacterium]|jgi:hypothetical protein
MIIYNITYSVPKSKEKEWLIWMQEVHIPEIMEKGNYVTHQLVKLLEVQDEDAAAFAVQFYAETKEKHLEFTVQHQASFKLKSSREWGQEVLSFSTLMEIVQ